MQNASYRAIGGPSGLLARLRPFAGNSMSAAGDPDTGGYQIYSYATMIARVDRDPETGGFVAQVTRRHYSPTTTRQQNICRAWLPGRMIEWDHGPDRGGSFPPALDSLGLDREQIREDRALLARFAEVERKLGPR